MADRFDWRTAVPLILALALLAWLLVGLAADDLIARLE
jgi:hypothetical protein